jgi:hypothetical protein
MIFYVLQIKQVFNQLNSLMKIVGTYELIKEGN